MYEGHVYVNLYDRIQIQIRVYTFLRAQCRPSSGRLFILCTTNTCPSF